MMTLLACAALFVAPVMAQNATSAVLDEIPAGSMGFVVVNNVKVATDDVDRFLNDIGVAGMLKDEMPKGLLEMLKAEIGLGEGFKADGGLAMMMLETTPYGIDLPALVEKKMGNDAGGEKVKLPWVAAIPGTSLEAVFTSLKDAKKETVGKATKVAFPFGDLFTVQHGNYILLSPVDKALEAVTSAKKTAKAEMSDGQKAVIGRSDVAVFVNLKVCGPVINKILTGIEKKMAEPGMANPLGLNFSQLFQMDKDQIAQIEAVTISARVAKTGFVIEELVDAVPGSAMAKQMQAMKPSGKSLVGRLPSFSYVVALGGSGNVGKEGAEQVKTAAKAISDLLVKASGGKVKAEQGDKLQKIVVDLADQCQGGQFVLGQAPADNGLIGMALLIEAKDAEKVKASLADSVALAQDIVKAAAGDDEDAKGFKIAYTKGAASASDVIEVTHPNLANMSEDDRATMKKFLGEDKIRILVATPDKSTVLLTFGGGKAFQDAATKAAKDGGELAKDKGLAAAMEIMPKNPVFILAVNAANLMDMVSKGADLSGAGNMLPPIKITGQTPLTIGAGIDGNSEHVVVFVPTEMVKEVVQIFQMFMGGRRGGAPPVVAPGDF